MNLWNGHDTHLLFVVGILPFHTGLSLSSYLVLFYIDAYCPWPLPPFLPQQPGRSEQKGAVSLTSFPPGPGTKLRAVDSPQLCPGVTGLL